MDEALKRDLKWLWAIPVNVEDCSYYWQPDSEIAFFLPNGLRFDSVGRRFEEKHGHCYCFLSDEINRIPEKHKDQMIMVEMMQSIIRDNVHPDSVAMAVEQIYPGILSEDTTHRIIKKYWGE